MILANFNPKTRGLHTTPETTYISDTIHIETISLIQTNNDLVYKRLSAKLVETIEHRTRLTHMQHNIPTHLFGSEIHWKEINEDTERDSFLATCGYNK